MELIKASSDGNYALCERLLNNGANVKAVNKVSVYASLRCLSNGDCDGMMSLCICLFMCVCVLFGRMDGLLFTLRLFMATWKWFVFC